MDVRKYLILIKGKDETQKVASYKSEISKAYIEFHGADKLYSYNEDKIEFFDNPKILDKHTAFLQGSFCNVEQILHFDKYCKIFFTNGYTTLILSSNILHSNKSNSSVFSYLKELAAFVGIKNDDNFLLAKQYEKIQFIPKESILYEYLYPAPNTQTQSQHLLLFPFGLNKSQYQATYNALNANVSIIQGPPGTGKTQSILNIIANIIYQGKNVAVVSNNNAAMENVFEKLERYGFGYICAILGKRENKEKFIQNQSGIYPDFNTKLEQIEDKKERIQHLNTKLSTLFEYQIQLALAKECLRELKIEYEHFNNTENIKDLPKIRNIDSLHSDTMLDFKIHIEHSNKISLFSKIKAIFFYGIGNFNFYKKHKIEILSIFEKLYYLCKIQELQTFINTTQIELESLDSTIKELQELSLLLLQDSLRLKYKAKRERIIFKFDDLWQNPQKIIDEYPVVLSTTHSLKGVLGNGLFDYLIIDEASQVDLVSGALSLSCAKNAIIVGDVKQLPNVISNENKQKIETLNNDFHIPHSYDYMRHSLLSSMIEVFAQAPQVLLKEHYRCHPKIIAFCNKKFYNDELVILSKDNQENDVLKAYITQKGNHARAKFNQRQIDVIVEEILPTLKRKVQTDDIGIISPYNEQKEHLQDNCLSVQIDTVHKYQGREKEAIIITTVDNTISDFVDDAKMLNVAITRAKRYFILVVSQKVVYQDSNMRDLIKYIQYNNFEIVQSKIQSIFDLLYKANHEALLRYLKAKRKISLYDSENLAFNMLKELLQKEFCSLDIAYHVPLYKLIRDVSLLNDDETNFCLNHLSHIDFVIYHKMDKNPVLAIEIDGFAFHKEAKQQKRDGLKNSIFEKYEIPLIRLATNASNEQEKIKKALQEILGF